MSDATRKAVVTTAQVQAALASYLKVRADLAGLKAPEVQEFDKGHRGKGFATYDAQGAVLSTWETKDAALAFYSSWVAVSAEVITLQTFKANAPKEEKATSTKS